MAYIDIDMYAGNKGPTLPEEVQREILEKMESLYTLGKHNIKYSTQYYAVKDFLAECGIYVEHDWPFTDGGFFFPTYYDAEYYQIYLDEIVG